MEAKSQQPSHQAKAHREELLGHPPGLRNQQILEGVKLFDPIDVLGIDFAQAASHLGAALNHFFRVIEAEGCKEQGQHQ